MRVSLIQDQISWADKESNFKRVEERLSGLVGKTDLVVLPEMFSTGFCTDKPELAETMEGETVQKLRCWALTCGFAIAGSFIAIENGRCYNRAFFVWPDGLIETEDKRHLFSLGGEDKFFSKGKKRLIVDYLGVKILVLVCYDIRFPVWSRNRNCEYDLLVYVANFPANRIKSWDVFLPARAMENQAYVCGVNCVGIDGLGIKYNGHSVLLDYLANPVVCCVENETSVVTGEVDIEKLKAFRMKSPFWKDADKFTIIE